jgi:hypothetical protein
MQKMGKTCKNARKPAKNLQKCPKIGPKTAEFAPKNALFCTRINKKTNKLKKKHSTTPIKLWRGPALPSIVTADYTIDLNRFRHNLLDFL